MQTPQRRGVAYTAHGIFCVADIVMIINPVLAAQDDLVAKTSVEFLAVIFEVRRIDSLVA
jgi:hypothetical protein